MPGNLISKLVPTVLVIVLADTHPLPVLCVYCIYGYFLTKTRL